MGSGDVTLNQSGYIINGIPSSCSFLFCEINAFPVLINAINESGNGDKIVTAFCVPKVACKSLFTEDNKIGEVIGVTDIFKVYALQGRISDTWIYTQSYKEPEKTVSVFNRPSSLDGYIPKNKKLLTYPYCYFGINLPNSSQKIFRFEDFKSDENQFTIISEINPNPTVLLIPKKYKNNLDKSMQDLVAIQGYPTLSTVTDYFNTWLAQNGNIVSLQMQQEEFNYNIGQVSNAINGVTGLISGIANKDVGSSVSAVTNSATNIISSAVNHDFYVKQQMAQIEKQTLLPDTVNLSSSNATIIGYDLIDNSIFNMYTIKEQFAKRIDDFFDMYGYLTNELKIPNINNRPYWNYVKTIGINIISKKINDISISQEELIKIKQIFDNGVTLWHDPDNFLNYSKNNH